MRVGLYFGSFNPIHVGHLIIASKVADENIVDQVWFVISPQNPLKKSAALLNEYHRLHLVNLAIEGDTRLKASDIEFKMPRPSYTIDTLVQLQKKYTNNTFSVIMGSDSYQNIFKWKDHILITNNYSLIIYLRPGFDVNIHKNNVTVLNAPFLDISATYIRDLIRNKHSIRYLVTDKVLQEIQNNNYYH